MTGGQEKETDLSALGTVISQHAPHQMRVCTSVCVSYTSSMHTLVGRAVTTGNRCFGPPGVQLSHADLKSCYLFIFTVVLD